jgi:hypothetical protein
MIREKFTPVFYTECIEKSGGRHLNIEMTADDFNLVRAL